MIKTLCLGGSFNPIHYGHLRCAAAAAQVLAYPRVLLIPNRQPPHKPLDASLASPDDRLAMCRLGAAAESTSGIHFDVDDLELRRPGPSYTIDTVRELTRSASKTKAILLTRHDEDQYVIEALRAESRDVARVQVEKMIRMIQEMPLPEETKAPPVPPFVRAPGARCD